MGATFIHLSGSQRGKTESLTEEIIQIGSGEGCHLRFDPQRDPQVASLHAEIRFENCEYVLSDRGQGVFVNNRMVPEIILRDRDIIELGEGGPKVRFRVTPEDRPCKPFRDICVDCFDRTIVAGENRLVAFPSFVKTILREVYREASWKVRVSVFSVFFLMIGSIFLSPVLLYRSYLDRIHYEKSILRLSGELQTDRLTRKELEGHLLEAKRQMAGYRTETDAALARLRQERERLEARLKESSRIVEGGGQRVKDLESQLTVASKKIRDLERGQRAGERVIHRFMKGVALVEAVYTLEDSAGRKIRFLSVDASGEPARDATGEAIASVEGKGPVIQIRSSGTGFLVGPGRILTNRHVVEPWRADQKAELYIDSGFRPAVIFYRAFFPGITRPFPLQIRRLSDKADVAVLQFDPGDVKLPVLPLERSPKAVNIGSPVILIGYPAGIGALLARADPVLLRKIVGPQGLSANEITTHLSKQGLIRPLTTWGHLSDVRPHQLTYDALTTSGGSGSPIFSMQGKVIGINQAVLTAFLGSNFGIPIHFGTELMDQK